MATIGRLVFQRAVAKRQFALLDRNIEAIAEKFSWLSSYATQPNNLDHHALVFRSSRNGR
jgi:hypothetical protein